MLKRHRKSLTILIAIGTIACLVGCHTQAPPTRPLIAFLRTDSTKIGAHRSGFFYLANIGFVYINTTANPVSMAGCGPRFPQLEKHVGGKWVAAYYPVYLACLMKPDFMIESGATFRGVLQFMASEPGHNTFPELNVDSIDGVYRLRWDFREGIDATTPGTRIVESISNEFQMVLK